MWTHKAGVCARTDNPSLRGCLVFLAYPSLRGCGVFLASRYNRPEKGRDPAGSASCACSLAPDPALPVAPALDGAPASLAGASLSAPSCGQHPSLMTSRRCAGDPCGPTTG